MTDTATQPSRLPGGVRAPKGHNAWFVALGSSFAAGAGLGDRLPGTPRISKRTAHGYPQQLARLLDVPSFTDMSSSGATLEEVLHGGQGRLGPQIDAVGPQTRLVTLTAGGNDIGYVGDLMGMARVRRPGLAGAWHRLFFKGPRRPEERDFAALHTTFVTTLTELRRRAPQALIIVATYPAILDTAPPCPALGISAAEADAMRGVGEQLAETTRQAVAATDAVLVDMAALSTDHAVCSEQPWIYGPFPKSGMGFHPTLAGATATAAAIADLIRERGLVG
ncbi:SGNH/GDSL hydrolase family protein [Devosia sp.]|uniref:SGNH/GDSL hydrolase family protein n=1 Tax=Devosia sp. TaxID=1871048 RepID=UPI003A8EEEFF